MEPHERDTKEVPRILVEGACVWPPYNRPIEQGVQIRVIDGSFQKEHFQKCRTARNDLIENFTFLVESLERFSDRFSENKQTNSQSYVKIYTVDSWTIWGLGVPSLAVRNPHITSTPQNLTTKWPTVDYKPYWWCTVNTYFVCNMLYTVSL